MVGMTLLALVGPVAAASSHDLDNDGLHKAIEANHALASYVRRNGMPDLAETRFLSDKPPWDRDEVALYYFDAHKEISFARAVILGDPSIHLERLERRLTDAEIEQLKPRAQQYGSCKTQVASAEPSDPTARAEAAASRAEAAAGRVEAAADAADRAADHAEAVAAKAESRFHKSLKK
jgi:hypothetical protein